MIKNMRILLFSLGLYFIFKNSNITEIKFISILCLFLFIDIFYPSIKLD
jgi:hypothetical protein